MQVYFQFIGQSYAQKCVIVYNWNTVQLLIFIIIIFVQKHNTTFLGIQLHINTLANLLYSFYYSFCLVNSLAQNCPVIQKQILICTQLVNFPYNLIQIPFEEYRRRNKSLGNALTDVYIINFGIVVKNFHCINFLFIYILFF